MRAFRGHPLGSFVSHSDSPSLASFFLGRPADIATAATCPRKCKSGAAYCCPKRQCCIISSRSVWASNTFTIAKFSIGSHSQRHEFHAFYTHIRFALTSFHFHLSTHSIIPSSDLKSQNIFLHGAEPNEILNLGDFGIAKGLDNTLANAKTQIGTPYYLSPEICAGKAYSFATDMWSLGILLYELLTLQMPFNGDSMPALFLNIIKGRPKAIAASYSAEMHALLDELLQKDPARRPTIAVLLQRPVLARLIERYLRYWFAGRVSDSRRWAQSSSQ